MTKEEPPTVAPEGTPGKTLHTAPEDLTTHPTTAPEAGTALPTSKQQSEHGKAMNTKALEQTPEVEAAQTKEGVPKILGTEDMVSVSYKEWLWGALEHGYKKRSVKIAGGAVVGAGAVGAPAGAAGAAVGGVGGIFLAPFTLGVSIPVGAAIGGTVGMLGGTMTGAAAGAGVATF